jgi:hypothetical protein
MSLVNCAIRIKAWACARDIPLRQAFLYEPNSKDSGEVVGD